MSSYYGSIQNFEIDPLLDLINNDVINISWDLSEVNPEVPYKKYEIYRFIGDLNVEQTSAPLDTDDYELIYTKEYTTDVTSASGITYTDAFDSNLPAGTTQAEIISDITSVKRALYYTILPYQTGTSIDKVHHCIIPHYQDVVASRSPKSQVLNNVYYEEMSRIWVIDTLPAIQERVPSRSRSTSAPSRMAIDSDHGIVWLGLRGVNMSTDPGFAARVDLGTGDNYEIVDEIPEQNDNNGLGVAMNQETYDVYLGAYSVPSRGGNSVVYEATPYNNPILERHNETVGMRPSNSLTHRIGDVTKYYSGWNDYASYGGIQEFVLNNGQFTYSEFMNKNGNYKFEQLNNVMTAPDGTIFTTTQDGYVIWSRKARTTPVYHGSGAVDTYHNAIDPDSTPSWYRFYYWNSTDNSSIGMVCSNFIDKEKTKYYVYITQMYEHVSTPSRRRIYRRIFNIASSDADEGTFDGATGATGAASPWENFEIPDSPNHYIYGLDLDNNENLWGLGLAHPMKFYTGLSGGSEATIFPYGGECIYPEIVLDQWPLSNTSYREVEWMLVKDPSRFTSSDAVTAWNSIVQYASTFPTAGIDTFETVFPDSSGYYYFINSETNTAVKMWESNSRVISAAFDSSQISNVITDIRNFATQFPDATANVRMYPKYDESVSVALGSTTVPWATGELHYNFSFAWYNFIGSTVEDNTSDIFPGGFVRTDPPSLVGIPGPSASLSISGIKNIALAPENVDWPFETDVDLLGTSGYDDSRVSLSAFTDPGNYEVNWHLVVGDYISDKGGAVNNTNIQLELLKTTPASYITTYDYHTPTQDGLSGQRFDITPNGMFTSYISGTWLNVYGAGATESNLVSAEVYERQPKASFDMTVHDLPGERYPWKNCNQKWKKTATEAKPVGTVGDLFSNGKIVWGTDPVSASIVDRSIARTWPISSWVFQISSAFDNTTNVYTITTDNASLKNKDTNTVIVDIQDSTITPWPSTFGYGTYEISLTAYASGSETPSTNTFYQVLSVKDYEPYANFLVASALTVPADYSDEIGTVSVSSISAYALREDAYTSNSFVSGYAPNLTIWFSDSSEAHTFPIKQYDWNFGDYYNEPSNTISISALTVTAGDFDTVCWQTTAQEHMVAHAFTMPGAYQVTLCATASTSNTQDCCARPGNYEDSIFVYVEEIPMSGCFSISQEYSAYGGSSPITAVSPVTVFANPSGLIPGSFPICRIDWDFGDGSDIVTITRDPSSTYSFPLTAYANDLVDPRNIIVSHEYTTTYSTVVRGINLSAYACNTNTLHSCGAGDDASSGDDYTITVTPPDPNDLIGDEEAKRIRENKHLIASKLYNNDASVFVFEGDETRSTYTSYISNV